MIVSFIFICTLSQAKVKKSFVNHTQCWTRPPISRGKPQWVAEISHTFYVLLAMGIENEFLVPTLTISIQYTCYIDNRRNYSLKSVFLNSKQTKDVKPRKLFWLGHAFCHFFFDEAIIGFEELKLHLWL